MATIDMSSLFNKLKDTNGNIIPSSASNIEKLDTTTKEYAIVSGIVSLLNTKTDIAVGDFLTVSLNDTIINKSTMELWEGLREFKFYVSRAKDTIILERTYNAGIADIDYERSGDVAIIKLFRIGVIEVVHYDKEGKSIRISGAERFLVYGTKKYVAIENIGNP